MSIDDQELRAIAFLACRVRKSTPGAAPWGEAGLMSNLRKLQNRNLHMTIEHVLRHAADPKAKNPGVLQGSFTPDAPTGSAHRFPPKKADECRTHPGQWSDHCAPCLTDRLAVDAAAPSPMVPGATAELVRAGLRKAVE